MTENKLVEERLGLSIPYEWWPAVPLLKEIEATGFGTVQIPAPPASVLVDARQCVRHSGAVREALDTTSLSSVVHGPGSLKAGSPEGDAVFEGLLAYAAELGARHIVYHGACHPDAPSSEDALLAETRSLARLAERAERLGVAIAIENLAPVFPGPEVLSARPLLLRTMVRRIGSPAVGLCIDVGHANVIASLHHADPLELIEPALDVAILFHLHDNLGSRRQPGPVPAGIDPLRLDLHLSPGRGTVPWRSLASHLKRGEAPLILEIHPSHRPSTPALHEAALEALGLDEPAHAPSV